MIREEQTVSTEAVRRTLNPIGTTILAYLGQRYALPARRRDVVPLPQEGTDP